MVRFIVMLRGSAHIFTFDHLPKTADRFIIICMSEIIARSDLSTVPLLKELESSLEQQYRKLLEYET